MLLPDGFLIQLAYRLDQSQQLARIILFKFKGSVRAASLLMHHLAIWEAAYLLVAIKSESTSRLSIMEF